MNKPAEPMITDTAAAQHHIPRAPYISKEFLQGEKDRLWPKVWLPACRESEVAEKGQYVTFKMADDLILVVRGEDGVLRAFFNVCQHRGKQLATGAGKASKFTCRYHGWSWNTDGTTLEVIDEEDWCGEFTKADVNLPALALDTWGGWVFVHMEPENAPPLKEWLAPLAHAFRNYKFEEFSPVWKRSVTLPCNWKVALDVFLEGYHAMTAHRQFNPVSGDNRWTCVVHGVHSMFHSRGLPVLGEPSLHIDSLPGLAHDEEMLSNAKTQAEKIHAYYTLLHRDTGALFTERKVRAMKRLAEEMPADASYMDLLMAMDRIHREEGKKDGLNWDQFTLEDIAAVGLDWHIFPNMAFLPQEDGALVYIARPDGDDPDSCVFDIYSLERFAPGKAPAFQHDVITQWRDIAWPLVLHQDFENVGEIQDGLKSRGYRFGRANPVAELTCINFHYHLRRLVEGAVS